MSLKTYITIHDQDIVLDYEAAGKFSRLLSSYQYVFVGVRDCEKIRDNDRVVIARELPFNIETQKFFIDFTAWFALVRNGLVTDDFAALVQFDTAISPTFEAETLAAMKADPGCILGYVPERVASVDFLRNNMGVAPLRAAIEATCGVSLEALMKRSVPGSRADLWPSTENVCMAAATLARFVDWFEPMVAHIGNAPPAGHAFERSIKFFSQHQGVPVRYLPHVLKHFQVNSHGTQDYDYRFDDFRADILDNKARFAGASVARAAGWLSRWRSIFK